MASQLTLSIPKPNYQIIGENIGVILAEELQNQFALDSGFAPFNGRVYLERKSVFQDTNIPCLNVYFVSSTSVQESQIHQENTYTYHIDVYTKGPTSRADFLRLSGAIRWILMAPVYHNLSSGSNIIASRTVTQILSELPDFKQDAAHIHYGRLILEVRSREGAETSVPSLLGGADTSVNIEESGEGYFYNFEI